MCNICHMNLIDWMICEVLALGISCNKCAYVDVVLVSAMIALYYSIKLLRDLYSIAVLP
jgi:hypothetical protein